MMVSFTRLTIAAFEKLPLSGHRDLRTPGRFRRLLYWATGVALAPAVDPLLPAEVLCTSALTLIIGTYASYFAQTSTPMLSLRWPRLFGKHGRSTRVDSRAEQAAQNAGSSPSATPAAAAQGRGHRGPHNPLSALSAPGCAFPAN